MRIRKYFPASVKSFSSINKPIQTVHRIQGDSGCWAFITRWISCVSGTNEYWTVCSCRDYHHLNKKLRAHNIDGELVAEYWSNQWEYVSLFNGQTPLKEAHNLSRAFNLLPKLFAEQGITKTLIKPVVWAGDDSRLASGSSHIFSTDKRAVHIPNAIQMNISVQNLRGDNLMVEGEFAAHLQQTLLQTSLASCLIYLPEEEAFERLALKHKYGLAAELCSPVDISGGHQGSIALYRDIGKHNQKMGIEPLIYDDKNNPVTSNAELIGITHGKYSVAGQPLPNDICLEIDDIESSICTYDERIEFEPIGITGNNYSLELINEGLPDSLVIGDSLEGFEFDPAPLLAYLADIGEDSIRIFIRYTYQNQNSCNPFRASI